MTRNRPNSDIRLDGRAGWLAEGPERPWLTGTVMCMRGLSYWIGRLRSDFGVRTPNPILVMGCGSQRVSAPPAIFAIGATA